MAPLDDVFSLATSFREQQRETEWSFAEYLQLCADDRTTYASAAERMLKAIGEPETIDTSRDTRMARVFLNSTIIF